MTIRETLSGRRIAVIGAGPIGLEAALYAENLGADVCVYERGDVAQHVAEWGHIEMFTPFEMNHTSLGRATLEAAGHEPPANDAFLIAGEWRDAYLRPLAERTPLADALALGAGVTAVGREDLLKGEHIGNGVRSKAPFRLLIERDGAERYEEADWVIDCSGSWSRPNWLGAGGVPAIGEREARELIAYHPIDVAGSERGRYAGRRTLLVGDGLSAATSAVALTALAREDPGSGFVWATRSNGPAPVGPIPDDPLDRRVALTADANALATEPAPGCEWLPGTTVRAVRWQADLGHFEVLLMTPDGGRAEEFDRVIANVGYMPDNSIYRELQVHECYASGAPMKLAAQLLAATAEAGGDCLQLGGFGPDVLVNPEPGFYILGMKSYGRNSAFLLQTGYEQVRDVFQLITGDTGLDLYADAAVAR
ncbi:MAG: NAD-binding protein [Gemmatimonadetes bacterium]|uniref:NAD-binding protein n=1 Tax=Candidatus Kutchimonas denitrificans TaxID=3056748 RepID=A0AAE5CDJ4_9BACT|nr:NAD-binding protein [Gemmatimonadota bacterium]NIR75899.1 NAD-binding protein [Candidatus Kutchimonas denitrificans]NIS02060.1 NAD-binding protein [Gemmatimonadota bacterium]NIT67866.1 NAD-binding protein [Gemmatimonadota bacterium]NIU53845.1 NAD-binding protein [Gemmatimonadota bacterium]